jgi:phage terminase large subunit
LPLKNSMLTNATIEQVRFRRNWFNPLYFILNNIIKVPTIRTVLVFGGKSSSKTVSIAQITTKQAVIHSDNTIAFRKESATIKTTLKKSYNLAIKSMRVRDAFEPLEFMFRSQMDSEIVLKGLDTEEKAKGLESYKFLNIDELNHFAKEEYEQFQMSLRGIPGQKVFGSWNPISETSWVKKELLDTYDFEETDQFGTLPGPYSYVQLSSDGSTVLIKTTYHDNYWIVGSPCGTYGYRDENLINYYEGLKTRNFNVYRVNVLGEWGKVQTGSEFWKQFDEKKHVQPIVVDLSTTIHVSLDENVNPYVTQTLWQIKEKEIKQVHQILSKSPDNNAPKAAAQLIKWLQSISYSNVVFIYGDPSAGKRSTIDANNASFYDKYIEVLTKAGFRTEKRVERSAPEVALSAAFINDIYETNLFGWSISISDKCIASIEDYTVVKEDAEGKMLKEKVKDKQTGVTYEPYGHISDSKRYFIIRILKKEFEQYKTRRRTTNAGAIFH